MTAPGERGSAAPARVVVMEDDPRVANAMGTALRVEGYEVIPVAGGGEALEALAASPIDLLLLDLGPPDTGGRDLLRRVWQVSDTPVVVVSGRGDLSERVDCLDAGADDYLTKPFAMKELLARVRTVLRRSRREDSPTVLRYEDLEVDLVHQQVHRAGATLNLTPTEYRLLEAMAASPGKLLGRQWLLSRVWGPGYGRESYHYLRVFVGQLRRKLGDDAAAPRWIATEPGMGYRWVARRGP